MTLAFTLLLRRLPTSIRIRSTRSFPFAHSATMSKWRQRITAHYVKLAEESGLLTTAKHFPGHGDTHQDSHDSLPSVDVTLDELRARELVPFQAAIDAGCSLIMTAHVAFPKIDPSGLPATLSPVFLQTLLREEMGFKGVVCSDSLLMTGVCDSFEDEGEMALATVNAGVDLLLDLREPITVVDYLVACVRKWQVAGRSRRRSIRSSDGIETESIRPTIAQ